MYQRNHDSVWLGCPTRRRCNSDTAAWEMLQRYCCLADATSWVTLRDSVSVTTRVSQACVRTRKPPFTPGDARMMSSLIERGAPHFTLQSAIRHALHHLTRVELDTAFPPHPPLLRARVCEFICVCACMLVCLVCARAHACAFGYVPTCVCTSPCVRVHA